jgi:hypothetical protein
MPSAEPTGVALLAAAIAAIGLILVASLGSTLGVRNIGPPLAS